MRDSVLRERKDKLLLPMTQQLLGGVHPNVVSLVALVVGLLSAAATLQGDYWAGLILWWANRVLDGLDGLVARVHSKQSDFGGYLDLILDFVIYLAVPLAFIASMPTAANLWGGLLLLTSYVINTLSWTTLSAVVEKRHMQTRSRLTTVEMPTGLIEGAETIFFYTLFFLLPGYLDLLFYTMAVLVFFTAGQRVYWAYRNL